MSNGGQLKSIELKFILHSYFRELQNNDLKEWHGDPTRDMPLLEVLKINGNNGWLPNQQLLNMPKLKEFLGVMWNTYCSACNLIRFPKMKHCLVMTRWKITRNIAEDKPKARDFSGLFLTNDTNLSYETVNGAWSKQIRACYGDLKQRQLGSLCVYCIGRMLQGKNGFW